MERSIRYESQIGICVCVYDVYFKRCINDAMINWKIYHSPVNAYFRITNVHVVHEISRGFSSYQSLISDKLATRIYNLRVTLNTIVRLYNIRFKYLIFMRYERETVITR